MDEIIKELIIELTQMFGIGLFVVFPVTVLLDKKIVFIVMIRLIRVLLYPMCIGFMICGYYYDIPAENTDAIMSAINYFISIPFLVVEFFNALAHIVFFVRPFILNFLRLIDKKTCIKKIKQIVIEFILNKVLDEYISNEIQVFRGIFFSGIIIICMMGTTFVTNNIIKNLFVVMFLLFLAIIYSASMKKLPDLVEVKAKKYIDERPVNMSCEEIKKYMNLGKDLLPINWVLITSGWGLLSAVVKGGINAGELYGDGLLLGSALSMFTILVLIIIPNYMFYSYSKSYLDDAENKEKTYFVQISDNELLKEYNVVVK